MKRFFIFLVTILALVCVLSSCSATICQHRDMDDDSLCDKCQESYTDGVDIEDESDPQVLYARAQKLGYEGSLEDFLALCKGADGVSVISTKIDEDGNLLVYYSNAPTTPVNLGKVIGPTGATGVGIASAAIDEDGNLAVTYTDGTTAILTHDWEYSYTLRNATCKQTGMDLYTCRECGLVRMVMSPMEDHLGGEWIVDIAPTGKTEGLKHVECVTCGKRLAEEILPCLPEASLKLGMGIVVSLESSKTGLAQVDATVATVVLDEVGKIVACRIDIAQNKFNLGDNYDFATEAAKTFETKMELGDRYGMAGKVDNDGNGVKLEWYEQTKAFEAYVVGKTVAEVEAIQTQEANGHQIAVDQALLDAGCSMQITEFIEAVVKACNDDQAMSFKTAATFTLGVAAKTTAAESTAVVADDPATEANEYADAAIAMYTDFAAAVVADGKIIATLNDAIQPKIAANAAGEITSKAFTATKRELKEDYHMAAYGQSMDWNEDGKVLEWYLQSAEFSRYVVGKTAAEVEAMATKTVESSGYVISAEDALLTAGCTIQITGLKEIVAKAARYASGEFTGVSSTEGEKVALLTEMIPNLAPDFAKIDEMYSSGNILKAWETKLKIGFAYIIQEFEQYYLVLVNAMGFSKTYDLDGADVTDEHANIAAKAEAHASQHQEAFAATLKTNVERMIPSATDVTEIKLSTFNTVVSAVSFTVDEATYYGFYSRSQGFNQMDIFVVIDENGAIAKVDAKQLVFDEEYFFGFVGIPDGYKEGFEGFTDETWNDDVALITSATMSSNAMNKAVKDAFDAFESIK